MALPPGADDAGAAPCPAVQALDRAGAVQFGPVPPGDAPAGRHVGFGVVDQGGEFGLPWPDLRGTARRRAPATPAVSGGRRWR